MPKKISEMSADEKLDWLCETVLRIDLAVESLRPDVSEAQSGIDSVKSGVGEIRSIIESMKSDIAEIREVLLVDEEAANLKTVQGRH